LPENMPINYFTADVEDWFHVLDLPGIPDVSIWEEYESRVEKNTHKLLELLNKHQVKATMFVLAWVAEKKKDLIREIHRQGHEIASHGSSHLLYYKVTKKEVTYDLEYAKKTLEDITGERVYGFRAPGFSVKKENAWVFDAIYEAGYIYDSSVFPAVRGHGGFSGLPLTPFIFNSGLCEFPVGVVNLTGLKIPFGGGGYFRLFPLPLFEYLAGRYTKKTGQGFVFYIHPREIDPDQPRMNMGLRRSFQTYVNIKHACNKLDQLLGNVPFGLLLRDKVLKEQDKLPQYNLVSD